MLCIKVIDKNGLTINVTGNTVCHAVFCRQIPRRSLRGITPFRIK